MKLTIFLTTLLTISIWGNLALLNRQPGLPDEPPEKPVQKKKLTAIVEGEPSMGSRLEILQKNGLSKDLAIAALEPELSHRLRERYMHEQTLEKIMRAAMKAHGERRRILENLSGGDDFTENAYTSYDIELKFNFDPPRDDGNKLKRRDPGWEQVPSRPGSDPRPGDRGVHEVLSQIGGITLTQDQKEKLVEISQTNHSDPEARATALGEAFDPEIAAQLQQCFEPGYRRAYQHAASVSDDLAERVKIASAQQR